MHVGKASYLSRTQKYKFLLFYTVAAGILREKKDKQARGITLCF